MLLTLLLAGFSAYAADHIEFEVASVKPSGPPGRGEPRECKGGLGTSNPGTWSCPHITLSGLIFAAYDLGTVPVPAARLDGHNVARDRRQSAGGNNQGTVPN
jgi:hypothetical protein